MKASNSMTDEYNFSPAKKEDYNYKDCIVKEFHLMGTMSEPMEEEYED